MPTREDEISVLTKHRNNLATATTFEEYRDRHVQYVDFLVERYKAESKADETTRDYIYRIVSTAKISEKASDGQ